jgi:hypothetical protein
MTAVGKILVFFNLLFSLGVGAVAIVNYTARTHWAAGYEELKSKYDVATASRTTYQTENDRLIKDRDRLNVKLAESAGKMMVEIKNPDEAAQKVADTLKDSLEQIKVQKKEIEDLRRQALAAEKKASQVETVAKVSLEDVSRRQADVEKMRETLKAETDRNVELVKEKNSLRDRAVAAEIQSTTLRDINSRLEAELQQAMKDLARIRALGGRSVARGTTNPPPENVEGLVQRFDSNSNLVTISLGSDAGLAEGNTMEVFRLGAVPKYVGQIKIVRVTPTQAVGQPTGRLNGTIQKGDRVASRIMGGN